MGKVSAVGPFTPIVIATRSIVGEKSFNQLRGKGITLHSQVPRARAKALRRQGLTRETWKGARNATGADAAGKKREWQRSCADAMAASPCLDLETSVSLIMGRESHA